MTEEGLLRPALIGGVLLGILSVVPGLHLVNCFCCAWVIGGGILAAYLHVKAAPDTVRLGRGAALGLLAGAIGAVVDTLFSIPLQFLMLSLGGDMLEQMRRAIEQVPEMPPELREVLERVAARDAPAGVMIVLLGGLFKLAIYPVMAMVGGAVGVALFEKRPPGSAAPSAAAPPTPPPPDIPPVPPPERPPGASE